MNQHQGWQQSHSMRKAQTPAYPNIPNKKTERYQLTSSINQKADRRPNSSHIIKYHQYPINTHPENQLSQDQLIEGQLEMNQEEISANQGGRDHNVQHSENSQKLQPVIDGVWKDGRRHMLPSSNQETEVWSQNLGKWGSAFSSDKKSVQTISSPSAGNRQLGKYKMLEYKSTQVQVNKHQLRLNHQKAVQKMYGYQQLQPQWEASPKNNQNGSQRKLNNNGLRKYSLRKQSGKIAKRNLHYKPTPQLIQELNLDGLSKVETPKASVAEQATKNTNILRPSASVSLSSKVMNIVISQPATKQGKNVQQLLDQIQELKKKLSDFQKRQEEEKSSLNQQENDGSERMQLEVGNLIDLKAVKKQFPGRLCKRIEYRQSRLSEPAKSFTSDKISENLGLQPATRYSAQKNIMASAFGFLTNQQNRQDYGDDMNKAAAINFRVRRPSKPTQGQCQLQPNQKELNHINKQILQQDKCFQTSRRQDPVKLQQQIFTILQKPAQRELNHQSDFRSFVQKYFVELGDNLPTRQMSQEQSVNLAKQTFKIFGINLHAELFACLSIKKFKNCVWFVYDASRTIIWYYEGKFYFGGWNATKGDGEKSGWGYDYVPRKYVYSGSFQENKRHGYGVLKSLGRPVDTLYEGNWVNGCKQGLGKQMESDGTQYIGSWASGKRHGYGILRVSQRECYSGQFTAGIKNGQGSETFKNGDRYVGTYKDGKFSGKGTYIWSNNSKYEGAFAEGTRNGYGCWIANHLDPTSDRYEGYYKDDKKNRFGVYRWKDGTSYQGEFWNDLKHGIGAVDYGDGRKAKLEWVRGSVVLRTSVEKHSQGINRRASSRGSFQRSECRIKKNDGNKMSPDVKLYSNSRKDRIET